MSIPSAPPPVRSPLPSRPLIEAINVTFAYAKRPVLRDLSVLVRPGEIVSLVGPNGCGKSTLLRLLLGQLHGSGKIRWDNKDLAQWSARDLARKTAYLPQHPTWTPGLSVLETITAGRYPHLGVLGVERERDERAARHAADLLGLSPDLAAPIDTLSGGQRQRTLLARCLAQEPAALLLDEPDTYLDLRASAALAGILRNLARDRNLAILMASHDLHLAAAIADRVLLLTDGTLIAEGPPRAVLTPENLERVYGVKSVLWQSDKAWGLGVVY
jgi:iron complex transport system ATP-binding protein